MLPLLLYYYCYYTTTTLLCNYASLLLHTATSTTTVLRVLDPDPDSLVVLGSLQEEAGPEGAGPERYINANYIRVRMDHS